jgi:peptidoglycan/xylan/chitin deacetylase (PgdA/CDA1 family)
MVLPHYYSALPPFLEAFRTGRAILTYHSVGPRPRGTRIKGLHLSPELFARQMAELATAGFSTPPLSRCLEESRPAQAEVLLTFDDGFRNVWEHALTPLDRHRFRAIEFLVADRLGGTNAWDEPLGEVQLPLMDAAQIRDWLAAGHEIGSHTLTHPRLTRLPAPAAREEITASRKMLEDRFGVAVRHFCYPYGDWDASVRELVAEAGYATACTTETGVNTANTDPFALRRITARYRSRSLKNLWAALRQVRAT